MSKDKIEVKLAGKRFNALTRYVVKKVNKSDYEKDSQYIKRQYFFNFYKELDEKNNQQETCFDKNKQEVNAPVYMSFVEQQKNMGQSSSFYSFEGPFELLNSDIADIRLLAKSIVNK